MTNQTPSIEMEDALTEEVKAHTRDIVALVAERMNDVVWQIANDYIRSHLANDVVLNYSEAVKREVAGGCGIYATLPDSLWGRGIRDMIFKDHKDEILPLIRYERFKEMEKEIEKLRSLLEYRKEVSY